MKQPNQSTGALRREVEGTKVVFVIGDHVEPFIDSDEAAGSAQMSESARMCGRVYVQIAQMTNGEQGLNLN